MSKHTLSREQKLEGARKALEKVRKMGPRYTGLAKGLEKNIRKLEKKVSETHAP